MISVQGRNGIHVLDGESIQRIMGPDTRRKGAWNYEESKEYCLYRLTVFACDVYNQEWRGEIVRESNSLRQIFIAQSSESMWDWHTPLGWYKKIMFDDDFRSKELYGQFEDYPGNTLPAMVILIGNPVVGKNYLNGFAVISERRP